MVKPTPEGIMVDTLLYKTAHIRIYANKDISIYHDGKRRRYREQVDVIRDAAGQFLVINEINLESYVKGVLYHEVPHYWPMSAIQAQAVATRTYAVYQLSVKKDKLYDLSSDIYSQVYGGRSAERHRTNIAADRTRGQILTYQGKVLPAYFHSTCGGQTENVAELWEHDLEPLKGVQCGFCTRSPHYRWKKNFQSKSVQDQLNVHGFKLGLIKEIAVDRRTRSGRVKTLKIIMRDGTSTTIPGVRFREIIGPNVLKSNYYDIDMKGYYFDVIGHGWGHGVGMCQWGAYQMSRQRYKYTGILEHYYPGASIKKISEI
jgi:stage II sporulation protein D